MSRADDHVQETLFQKIRRREFLRTMGALGIALGAGQTSRAYAAGQPAAIRGDTVRFLNYTNWIGQGEYNRFRDATGAEVREIPTNQNRSVRVLADPTSIDMVLDSIAELGAIDAAGLLLPLDLNKIPNFAQVSSSLKQGLASVAQHKAVPVDFGRTGILYRSDLVTEPLRSWADFWRASAKHSGKVLLPDASAHCIRNALIMLKLDGNSHNPKEIDRAADELIRLKPYVGVFAKTGPVKSLLEGSIVMAMTEDWQGVSSIRNNPHVALKWVDPSEGAGGYLDCIAAVKGTAVQPAIEQFLNFHLSLQNAADFCNTLSTPPVVPASRQYVKEEIRNDPILNPSEEVAKRVSYSTYLGEAQRYWDDAWARVKAA